MKKFIEWNQIPAGRGKGTEKVKCPLCSPERTNKADRSLSVNHSSGLAKCHYCEAVSVRDKVERQTKAYELPPQTWQNYTALSDKLVKWIRDERHIRQETLISFGITEEKYYQPAHAKEVNNIVFNYFEGDQVVNKKYRSGDKKFTQSKGGKPILYNVNSAIGAEELWIVEGEFDVLALAEVGIKSAVSLPAGANDNDDYWINSEPYLKDVKKFIIGVDTDEKGTAVREKIAQRLGRYRCEFVEWNGKDANDDLKSGQLRQSVQNKQRFAVGGTFTINDMISEVYDLYDNGLPKTIKIENKSFGSFNDTWSTMKGHLVTVTGIPSHGKSTFVEWLVLNYVNECDMKVSFFSPEHSPMALHQSRLIERVTGKPFYGKDRMSKSVIDRYQKWANERVYLTSAENGEFPTWNWLLDKFKEQMYSYGIDIFVIDAFNKLDFDKGGEDLANIRRVLTKITMFAQMHNVLVFLVAHPTKMKKDATGAYEVPSLYDVSGSADFRNQTHDGFTIHRYFGNDMESPFTSFVSTKLKFNFQGSIGDTVSFQYDNTCGRFYATGGYPDKTDWTEEFSERPQFIDFDDFVTDGTVPF